MTTPAKIYYVDRGFVDNIPLHEFSTLQAAIDQIPAWQKAKIILYDDVFTPPLRFQQASTNISIDGLDTYGINFSSGSMIDIGTGNRQTLKFRNITFIRGERLIIADDFNLGFYNSQSVMCSITLDSGKNSNLYIDHTKLYGNNGPAIHINNSDADIEIFNSYVKGAVSYPAILFNTDSDEKLKAKHSVLLHGSGDTPIQVSGAYTVGVNIYDCVSNKRIVENDLIEWVFENSCKADPKITF